MRTASLRTLLVLAVAASSWPAAPTSAQRIETVVMPFDGTGSDAIRSQVHEALGLDPRLRVAPLDERAPDAQILVTGSVSGRGARRTFEIAASDAGGNQIAVQSARVGRGAAGRRAVEEASLALIDEAIPRLPPPPAETPPEPAASEEPGREAGEASPSADAGPAPVGTDPALLSLVAGMVVRNRTSDVRLESGGSKVYDSGFYIELTAAAELRPLARDPGLARGLFVRAAYANAVGLGTQDCGPGGCQSYPTTFFRLYGDVGFLFDVGRVVEIGGGLGFGFEAYQIADNQVMPTAEYPYLRPAVRGRVRILDERVLIDAELGLRSLLGRARLGEAFGANGDSIGLDAGLGLTGLLDFGLLWRADFSWAGYWHSFAGGGTLDNGQSGADQGVRIGLMLGYGFR
jgi:hypothetical protein